MSPAGATPNGNHLYLYLPIRQENVVKYDAFYLILGYDVLS